MSADRTKPAGAFCGHCEQPLWDASDHAPWCSMSETQSTTRSTPEGLREAVIDLNAAIDHMWNDPNRDHFPNKRIHQKNITARQAQCLAALSAPSPTNEPAKGSGGLSAENVAEIIRAYVIPKAGTDSVMRSVEWLEGVEVAAQAIVNAALNRRPAPEVPQGWRDAGEVCDMVIAAFQAGCEAVHANYQPDPDPNFYEAACDYAASVIAAAPPPEGRG